MLSVFVSNRLSLLSSQIYVLDEVWTCLTLENWNPLMIPNYIKLLLLWWSLIHLNILAVTSWHMTSNIASLRLCLTKDSSSCWMILLLCWWKHWLDNQISGINLLRRSALHLLNPLELMGVHIPRRGTVWEWCMLLIRDAA